MALIVTGSIGFDTVQTPAGGAKGVLGGSAVYFAAAASFFGPVRMVAAVGGDFKEQHRSALARFDAIDARGIEVRPNSNTFAWGGKYLDDINMRETLFTELGVLGEAPAKVPEFYSDSRCIFLANTHPAAQLGFIDSFPQRQLVVADTMNLWIDTARDELLALLKRVDGLVLNDQEAMQLTGERNAITAGKAVLELGPTFAVVKKGEHGVVLLHRDGVAALPAYPAQNVVDPTGAGDSFAGGMMGHIARSLDAEQSDGASFELIRSGLAHGTVIASFTLESFSLDRLAELTRDELDERLRSFREIVHIDG